MKYKIEFTHSASQDLEYAFLYYENESAGLGWEFRNEIALCIEKIIDDSVSYQVYFNNIRKIFVTRFPYLLYFIKDELHDKIVVGAVLHEKRSPELIKKKLGVWM